MAAGNYREYLRGDTVKAKKYFYVMRPILACRWILDHGTPPPMLFSELMDAELDPNVRPAVERLLDIKMNSPEIKLIPRVEIINEYLDHSIEEVNGRLAQLPDESIHGWEELDALFLRVLDEYEAGPS